MATVPRRVRLAPTGQGTLHDLGLLEMRIGDLAEIQKPF